MLEHNRFILDSFIDLFCAQSTILNKRRDIQCQLEFLCMSRAHNACTVSTGDTSNIFTVTNGYNTFMIIDGIKGVCSYLWSLSVELESHLVSSRLFPQLSGSWYIISLFSILFCLFSLPNTLTSVQQKLKTHCTAEVRWLLCGCQDAHLVYKLPYLYKLH